MGDNAIIARSIWKRPASNADRTGGVCCEPLEERRLLSRWGGEGEDGACGPVQESPTSAGTPPVPPRRRPGPIKARGMVQSPAAAAAAEGPGTHPQVTRVDVPAGRRSGSAWYFPDVNASSLIANGSITSTARLVNLVTGPLTLTAGQFSYDDGMRALTLTLNSALGNGGTELRLDGSQFRDGTDQPLVGGQGGLSFPIPTFAAATLVQAAGADLKVDSYSVPALADWNHDGVTDLIVGEKTTAGRARSACT